MVREVAKDKKKPESGDKPPAPADEDDSDSDDTETSTDTMPVKWDPPDPVKKPKKKSFVEAVKFNAELSQWNFHVATTRSSRTSDNGRVYDWSNVNKDEEYSLDGVTLYGAEGAIETRLFNASFQYSSNTGLTTAVGPSSILDGIVEPTALSPYIAFRVYDLHFENGFIRSTTGGSFDGSDKRFEMDLEFQEFRHTDLGELLDEPSLGALGGHIILRHVRYRLPRRLFLEHRRWTDDATGETIADDESGDDREMTETRTYFNGSDDSALMDVESRALLFGFEYWFQRLFDFEETGLVVEPTLLFGPGLATIRPLGGGEIQDQLFMVALYTGLELGYRKSFFRDRVHLEVINDFGTYHLVENWGGIDFKEIKQGKYLVPDSTSDEWRWDLGGFDILNNARLNLTAEF